ncbi:MAG TPA: zinc ribbon domain-containing protein [Tepidisphaeraceae bacterium]|nr:zinc ribbon domain-containing protein [Tepidisphaeraceae bacterium]
MTGRMFTFTSAISLLLCVTTAVLWVRSYVASDGITYCRDLGGHREGGIDASWDSSWFAFGFGRTLRQRRGGTKLGWRWLHSKAEPISEDAIDAGFGSLLPAQIRWPGIRVRWTRRVMGPGDTIWTFQIVIRLAILFLLTAILPIFWLARRLVARRRIHSTSRCIHCGYDLRASNDRCPECGTEIREDGKKFA